MVTAKARKRRALLVLLESAAGAALLPPSGMNLSGLFLGPSALDRPAGLAPLSRANKNADLPVPAQEEPDEGEEVPPQMMRRRSSLLSLLAPVKIPVRGRRQSRLEALADVDALSSSDAEVKVSLMTDAWEALRQLVGLSPDEPPVDAFEMGDDEGVAPHVRSGTLPPGSATGPPGSMPLKIDPHRLSTYDGLIEDDHKGRGEEVQAAEGSKESSPGSSYIKKRESNKRNSNKRGLTAATVAASPNARVSRSPLFWRVTRRPGASTPPIQGDSGDATSLLQRV